MALGRMHSPTDSHTHSLTHTDLLSSPLYQIVDHVDYVCGGVVSVGVYVEWRQVAVVTSTGGCGSGRHAHRVRYHLSTGRLRPHGIGVRVPGERLILVRGGCKRA